MATYLCRDENGEAEIEAKTPGEAAREYVEADADWIAELTKTTWFKVYVKLADNPDDDWSCIRVEIDPPEPDCSDETGHTWENEIVRCHGGGVTIEETCEHCQCRKVVDTWAQDPEDGVQGLTAVSYSYPEE